MAYVKTDSNKIKKLQYKEEGERMVVYLEDLTEEEEKEVMEKIRNKEIKCANFD